MLHTIDEHKFYYPYKSSRKQKKFMVLINDDGQIKWVHFGDKKYEHYTEVHLNEQRKINYDKRNQNRDKERNIITVRLSGLIIIFGNIQLIKKPMNILN